MTHEHKLITEEARMTIAKPSIHVSDSIEFKSISTGGNSAGNGGDGIFKGYVVNAPTLNSDASNTVHGASLHFSIADHVDTTATQTNSLMADMHQDVMAGIGGNGGNGNVALGGNVDFNFESSI
jgi:hypothetical protein